jgi:hypothetical protein
MQAQNRSKITTSDLNKNFVFLGFPFQWRGNLDLSGLRGFIRMGFSTTRGGGGEGFFDSGKAVLNNGEIVGNGREICFGTKIAKIGF